MARGSLAMMLVSLVALAAASASTTRRQDPFPDGAGKDDVLEVCRDCHGPDIVLVTRKTPDEWVKVLRDMAALGVEGSPEAFERIRRYLDRHFAVVQVNVAGIDELVATLGVSREVAAAIVDYRAGHGPFASLSDLKKVPGLPSDTADGAKDRILFDGPHQAKETPKTSGLAGARGQRNRTATVKH